MLSIKLLQLISEISYWSVG